MESIELFFQSHDFPLPVRLFPFATVRGKYGMEWNVSGLHQICCALVGKSCAWYIVTLEITIYLNQKCKICNTQLSSMSPFNYLA